MSLPQLFANSPTPGSVVALTTLTGNGGSIAAGATSFITAAAAPTALRSPGQFHVVIDNEIFLVTAGASGTTWTVSPGQESSSQATHTDGTSIFAFPTAAGLANFMAMVTANLQEGVILSTDLLVGTISINTGTGALTFTPAATGTQPAWIQNTSNLLVATGYAGGAQTLTPTLPASTKYAVIGVEIDTTGAITLVKGTDTATQLNTGSLIAANTPATTSGKMRIADFAYWNNAGTINFSDHTTTATKGTNWIDRRPWTRGALASVVRFTNASSTNDYTTTSASPVIMDATNLAFRVECSSNPIRLTWSADVSVGVNASPQFYIFMDGANQHEIQPAVGAGAEVSLNHVYHLTPSAGSHLFAPYWSTNAGTLTAFARTGFGVVFTVEEIVRQNANNGTA